MGATFFYSSLSPANSRDISAEDSFFFYDPISHFPSRPTTAAGSQTMPPSTFPAGRRALLSPIEPLIEFAPCLPACHRGKTLSAGGGGSQWKRLP